ncbi:hypothetical protein LA080_006024 [Diaporthe eres]|nr:hypothetical protein LA080_006024 [Diaporthe eres]
MDGHVVGIVEVPVTNLRFREDLPARAFDQNIQRYLEPILEYDVQHSDPRNQIAGIIDEEEHCQVLQELGLTVTELLDTTRGGPYPTLRNHIVEHGDGQHRIAAAKSLGNDAFWTVALHKFTNKSSEYLSQVGYVKRRTQHCTYETRHSDGEIYLNIRHSRITMQTEEESRWRFLLKGGKRIAVDMIFERPGICEALDRLCAFQGLWAGMQLGNWHRHLALDCDIEIQNYLANMYHVWADEFSLGDANIFAAVCIETVRTLEGRAPYACAEDRELIEAAFQSGKIYARIVNPKKRELILERVLEYRGIIPSMRTLHENLKYFAIAVRIIREFLLPHEFRSRRNGLPSKRRRRLTNDGDPLPSLRDALRQRWNEQATAFIEVSEGEFWPALGQPSFQCVYIQLFLAALRQFPFLNDQWGPRIDQGEEVAPATDPACAWLFCRRAHLLGIQGSFAYRTATSSSLPMLVDVDSGAEVITPVDRRWGRPHTRTFRAIQQAAFLPILLDDGASSQMCVPFVLREFITAFMGATWDVSNAIDWEGRHVSLANPPSQPGISHPVEDSEVNEDESMDVVEAMVPSPHNSPRSQHHFRDPRDGEGQGEKQFHGLPSGMSDIDMLEAGCNQPSTAAIIEDMTMVDAPSNRRQSPEQLESSSGHRNDQPSFHSHGAHCQGSSHFSPYRSCSSFAVDNDNTTASVGTEGHGLQWNDVPGSDTLTNSWTSLGERDKVVNYWNDTGEHHTIGGTELPDSRSSSLKRTSGRHDTQWRAVDAWTSSSPRELSDGPSSLGTFDRAHRCGEERGYGRSSRWSTSLPSTNSPISVGRPGWGTETLASISARSLGGGSMRASNDRSTPLVPGRYSSHTVEDSERRVRLQYCPINTTECNGFMPTPKPKPVFICGLSSVPPGLGQCASEHHVVSAVNSPTTGSSVYEGW